MKCCNKSFKHECTLPVQPDVVSYFFEERQFLQKMFRELFLITTNLKIRRCFIKSMRAIEQDKAFHLTQHYYMIHPFSIFRFYWELFMGVVIFAALMCAPLYMMAHEATMSRNLSIAFGFRIVMFTDIIINFFTGFLGPDNSIELSPSSVAKKYLKTLFVPDIISIMPLGLFVHSSEMVDELLACRFTILTLYLSAIKLTIYGNRFRQKVQISVPRFRFIQSVVLLIIGIQLFSGLICVSVHLDQDKQFESDPYSIYLNAAALTAFGTAKVRFLYFGYELVCRFLLVIFGFIMINLMVAQIIMMSKSFYATSRKFKCVLRELEEYCRYKDLPPNIETSIYNYYLFKFNRNYFNEREVFSMVSNNIKTKVNNHTYQVLLTAQMFKNCPRQLIESFFIYIKIDTYMTNDLVYSAGTMADHVLFLNTGTLAIYGPDMSEIVHIEEGSTLCDYAIIFSKKMKHKHSVYAVERSEIFSLHRDDFRKIIIHHPEQYEKIIEAIEEKMETDEMKSVTKVRNTGSE